MTPETAQALLYWAAGNMHVWAGGAVMVLAGSIIGLCHLVATGLGER